jgi:hypothetical protein
MLVVLGSIAEVTATPASVSSAGVRVDAMSGAWRMKIENVVPIWLGGVPLIGAVDMVFAAEDPDTNDWPNKRPPELVSAADATYPGPELSVFPRRVKPEGVVFVIGE